MSFAPPLIAVQVYNLGNFHGVLRLLLNAPTCEYLCLKLDPLCDPYDRPHLVGANQEELASYCGFDCEKALSHNSGRSGQRFWMLAVPLHLQLHPCIPPSSGRLMVSVAIRHVS